MFRAKLINIFRITIFVFALIGLPVWLITFGWPFTSEIPSTSYITEIVNGNRGIPNSFVVNLLVCSIWLIWFQFLYVIALEIKNHIKGDRSKIHFTLPGMQIFVAKSLASIILFLGIINQKPAFAESAVDNTTLVESERNPEVLESENSSILNLDFESLLVGMGIGGAIVATGLLSKLRRSRQYSIATRDTNYQPENLNNELATFEKALNNKTGFNTGIDVKANINNCVQQISDSDIPAFITNKNEQIELKTETEKPIIINDATQVLTNTHEDLTPTLVSISADTYINLEAIGVLNIAGKHKNTMALARSIVHELAINPHAYVDIRTTLPIDGVRSYSLVTETNVDNLSKDLLPWLEDVGIKFSEASLQNAGSQRIKYPQETIAPVVIILNEVNINKSIHNIISYANKKSYPLAVVILSENPINEYKFRCEFVDETQIKLSHSGKIIEAQQMSSQVAQNAMKILDEVKTVETKQSQELGQFHIPKINDLQKPNSEQKIFSESLKIELLGEIRITGASYSLTNQQLSLVTYLSCNGPSTREQIIEAIWDGQRISNSRFSNLLAESRKIVGRNVIPEADKGKYSVSIQENDYQEFIRTTATEFETPQDQLEAFSKALTKIYGQPFTIPQTRYWTWVGDNSLWSSQAECYIADIASQAVELATELSNVKMAQSICEMGLVASPLDMALIGAKAELLVSQNQYHLAKKLVEEWEYKISKLDCGDPPDNPRNRLQNPQLRCNLQHVK